MLADPATWEREIRATSRRGGASLKGGIDRVTLVDEGWRRLNFSSTWPRRSRVSRRHERPR